MFDVLISGIKSSGFDLAFTYKFKVCFGPFPITFAECVDMWEGFYKCGGWLWCLFDVILVLTYFYVIINQAKLF